MRQCGWAQIVGIVLDQARALTFPLPMAAAVEDALSPFNASIDHMPLVPDEIRTLVTRARK